MKWGLPSSFSAEGVEVVAGEQGVQGLNDVRGYVGSCVTI